ncbi:hypothetical protein K2Y11_23245 [bacterium]|nr:hypothetical protein [bacterium]
MLSIMFLTAVLSSNHYVIVFSWQDVPDGFAPAPKLTHSFATFVQVSGDKIDEEFTISWAAPYGVRILAAPEPGQNWSLQESLTRASEDGLKVMAWGPYRVSDAGYEKAKTRYFNLESAESNQSILYKAVDRRSRRFDVQPAINCIHALSDMADPNLATGNICGNEASRIIVNEFVKAGIILGDDHQAEWIRKKILADYPVATGTATVPSVDPNGTRVPEPATASLVK